MFEEALQLCFAPPPKKKENKNLTQRSLPLDKDWRRKCKEFLLSRLGNTQCVGVLILPVLEKSGAPTFWIYSFHFLLSWAGHLYAFELQLLSGRFAASLICILWHAP